ncbi:MAG: carboxypeptidase-like regulatory domain-containing protein [Acidobacteriaceae bacterium]
MQVRILTAALAATVMVSLFFSPALLAQQATTSLNGVVTDSTGAVLPGASVTIVRAATSQTLKTTTNAHGEYSFLQLSPGTWTATASASGFSPQSKVGELLVSKPATIDFTMGVQAASEVVNVTAETATLNTSDATLGNAVPNATIQSLPMEDRNVPDLLSLQPGVLYLGHSVDAGPGTADSDSRTGAVNGVRSDQGNVTMDGLDDNDQRTGDAFIGVLRETLDSVQEFRVVTGLANSDQGRSAGAEINLVTKGGTDAFHGGAYEYNRNTATAANDWFNKQAELSAGEPNVPGQYIRNTYGADVGGPILKKKLFFFGNYEASHTRENAQVARTTPFASFKSGNLTYLSNNTPVILTPAQVASMDPHCQSNGTCPWGGGDDPNILSLLQQYPTANGSALGDGYNTGSYTFSSPSPQNQNTTIARIDWYPSERNQIFVRGNLQDDTSDGVLQFPGQAPSYVLRDNTKGIAVGDTWTITNALVNDFRYGYTRQGYSDSGNGCGAHVTFAFFSQPTPETCTTIVHVPVQNIIDNAAWTRGNHTLSWGVDLRIITNSDDTDTASYSSAQVYNEWLSGGGVIAGSGGSLDPDAFGYPTVDGSFDNSYDIAATMIAGLVPLVTGQYNFHVNSAGTDGTTMPQGTYVPLNFLSHEFEYYLQDQWRLRPNLILTFGIRQVFLQPPYETHGQQVQPTVDTHQWFITRAAEAAQGVTDQPDLTFAPSGQSRGAAPYWNMQWNNIAPRLAIAYSPDSKTSIRMGVGMYYQHFGQGIVDSFAQFGSYGLQTSISNPDGQYPVDTVPRFTGLGNLPPLVGVNIPSVVPYPYTPPNNVQTGLALTWGIDNRIKTPYTIAADLSVQRQFSHDFSIEADYVGTFGRHLLQQLDLAEPLDLVDPKSGMDYFRAGTILAKAADAGQNTVQAIPYWEDMFPWLATGGMSATQNIYTNLYQGLAANGANDSYALIVLDAYCLPQEGGLGCGPYADANGNVTTRYYQRQFSALYAWSSLGSSSYNAMQLTARKTTSSGLDFNFSYTLSNSIDMGSDAERNAGTGTFSQIINSFSPQLNRGDSDFDVRHLVSGDAIYQLPFGHGRRFAADTSRAVDALIGGWGLSGILRWSSGLPFTVYGPYSYPTNFAFRSAVVETAPVKMHRHLVNGLPEAFADPDALNNGIANSTPIRYPYPGEAGSRNIFRGDGYFEPDASLSKDWSTWRESRLRFAWEVFNLSNSARFDTNPISSLGGLNNTVTTCPGFGVYSSQLVQSRKQQFSLRYDF